MGRKSFRGVLFDMDGTLVNSLSQHKKALVKTLDRYGIEISPDEWNKHIGYSSLVKEVIPALSEERVQNIVLEIAECFRNDFLSEVRLFDGAKETIEFAHRHFKRIGIVTSSSIATMDAVLDHCGVRQLFDVTVCKEHVKHHKPHPEPFLVGANEQLQLPPRSVIAVEDAGQGILSAVAAGTHTIAIATTTSDHDILLALGAHQTAHDHVELKMLLEILYSMGYEEETA